jgi:hypothetical protein
MSLKSIHTFIQQVIPECLIKTTYILDPGDNTEGTDEVRIPSSVEGAF